MGEPTMSDEQVAAWVEMAQSQRLGDALRGYTSLEYKRELQRQVERGRK